MSSSSDLSSRCAVPLDDSAEHLFDLIAIPDEPMHMGRPRRVISWLEKDASEGERWLRESAGRDDVYAMERLGERLIEGAGVRANREEGVQWLRRAAQAGNSSAMEKLGKYSLDGTIVSVDPEEGMYWLNRAISSSRRFAGIGLAIRSLAVKGFPTDASIGHSLLKSMAHNKACRMSMLLLGAYALAGRVPIIPREHGRFWLHKAGCFDAERLAGSATWLYCKFLNRSTQLDRKLVASASAVLLSEAYAQGHTDSALSLAYLVRRDEASSINYILDDLLAPSLAAANPLALINQALRLATGCQSDVDWRAADELVGRIGDATEIFNWWSCLAEENDIEGHLVLAWLKRHHLLSRTQSVDIGVKLDMAQSEGWAIPEWLNEEAPYRST